MDASNAPQIIEHQSKSVNFTPFCTRWVPCSARFVALGINPKGTGALQVYQLEKGELKLKAEAEKKAGFKCGTFGASAFEKRHLATGDYDGKLNIWDLEKLDKPVYSVDAHSKIINCIDGCGGLNIGYGAPEIVTGSMDGCVRVWDPRTQDAVTSLEPADGAKPRDCWAVAFGNSYSDEERCVCAGYDNGDIKLLDLRMNKLRWETNVKNGVTSLEFDRKDIEMNKLIISMLESRMSVVDMRTYHPEEGFAMVSHKAHKSTVWFGRPLPQNRDIFMTGGGKGDVHLYKYNYPQQRVVKDTEGRSKGVAGTLELLNKKSLSEQPLVSFDWSADKQGLAVLAALDQSLKVVVVTRLGQL